MALACSGESLYVPVFDTLWRGSSISVIMASTSRAGQSRAIKVSRAVLASLEPQFSNPLDHRRLVYLVGDLADDDRFTFAPQSFDLHLAAHDNGAAAEGVGGADA